MSLLKSIIRLVLCLVLQGDNKWQPQKRRTIEPSKSEMAYKYVQFSKRITVYVLVFWGFYRLAQLVVVAIAPDTAESLIKLVSGVDTMAIFFGGFYTTNSISEKALAVHKDVQKYMYVGSTEASTTSETTEPESEIEDVENG